MNATLIAYLTYMHRTGRITGRELLSVYYAYRV